jgi:excisionase family DNA binding protein
MKLLIADEVAKILRVDRQRVYELTREKALPAIKLGLRQYRYSEDAIRAFLERGGLEEGSSESQSSAPARITRKDSSR